MAVQLGSGTGAQPFKTVKYYDNWIKRASQVPVLFDLAIANSREGVKNGVVQPKTLMVKVVSQLDALIKDKPEDTLPKADPKAWKGLPADAGVRLAKLKDAIVLRDYGALRAQLADDVVWSLGGAPGADTAMAMWQADPEALDALVGTMDACVAAGDGKRVTCPGGDPAAGQWQLVLELRGKDWKVVSFVKGE
jgi:hypothetical protein